MGGGIPSEVREEGGYAQQSGEIFPPFDRDPNNGRALF